MLNKTMLLNTAKKSEVTTFDIFGQGDTLYYGINALKYISNAVPYSLGTLTDVGMYQRYHAVTVIPSSWASVARNRVQDFNVADPFNSKTFSLDPNDDEKVSEFFDFRMELFDVALNEINGAPTNAVQDVSGTLLLALTDELKINNSFDVYYWAEKYPLAYPFQIPIENSANFWEQTVDMINLYFGKGGVISYIFSTLHRLITHSSRRRRDVGKGDVACLRKQTRHGLGYYGSFSYEKNRIYGQRPDWKLCSLWWNSWLADVLHILGWIIYGIHHVLRDDFAWIFPTRRFRDLVLFRQQAKSKLLCEPRYIYQRRHVQNDSHFLRSQQELSSCSRYYALFMEGAVC